jgi:tetratricopeptide (TPR) repeat protein
MKTKLTYLMILAVLCAVAGAIPAWAQLATVNGKVADNDKPLVGVQVIYTSKNTGRQIKLKTDKKGEFFSIGVPIDTYTVTVIDASGKTVFEHDQLVGQGGDNQNNTLNIDITKGATASAPAGANVGNVGARTQEFAGDAATAGGSSKSSGSGGPTKYTKEQLEAMKAQNAKAESINALITQYQAAVAAKDWKAAITPLQAMTTADPTRWEYFQALGAAQFNVDDYENSVESYEKGIQIAQGYVSGATPKDPKNANSDPAKAKAGEGQMLAAQGNAYLKLNKKSEAVAAFTKAAEMDPNPGTAYFNLCATQYNSGNTEGALAACDKAIAADPNKADAYFIKGSLMLASSTLDKDGKVKATPGTAEALNKYLELAPDGQHAADVKQMLEYIGSKVETTYKGGTKKK